jgi:calcineurin-like phosphoesterase family protein
VKTWVTSDPHFYHANVIRYCNRPFNTVEHMNEVLVGNWNAVVQPEDRVIVIGDFSLAARAAEVFASRLNGDKDLYLGNHDFPHPAHQKGRKPELREKWTKEYLRFGFRSVQLLGTLEIPGVATFRLSHLPYQNSYPDDLDSKGKPRYFKDAPEDDGTPLLCGHVHDKWLFRRTPKGTPMINVGLDAPGAPWSGQYRPASLEEIAEVYLAQTT